MWNRKKSQPSIRSLLGEGSALQGTIRFREGLRIDGEVHGDVVADADHPSMLVISEKARVQGKVKAAHVIINGQVLGPVEATELLELQPNARIVGDVRYAVLEMHPGALIEGELRPLKSADRPALTLAASNDV
ncbi:MAG: polymer-forming cytoskeletal protein [Aquabacterium sp.]|nr:polymer-forming cytoskeletal protein [Aquabacterium sp.]